MAVGTLAVREKRSKTLFCLNGTAFTPPPEWHSESLKTIIDIISYGGVPLIVFQSKKQVAKILRTC